MHLSAIVLGFAVASCPFEAATAAPAVCVSAQPGQSQSPLSNLALFLDLIMRLIGGNPEELAEPRLSLTTKLNIVRGQYETNGIPHDLTILERQQLLTAILEAHVLIRDPAVILEANVKAINLFDTALRDMWDDLGGTPGVLDP